MHRDAPHSAGEESLDPVRPNPRTVIETSQANAERARAALLAATKFVGRVSLIDADTLRTVVATWHDVMRTESETWFAAERATAEAIVAAERTGEQGELISELSDHFLRRVWYRAAPGHAPRTPERRVGATEASGQYVATLAMLALLVRDHIAAREFDVLYSPFVQIIRAEELARE